MRRFEIAKNFENQGVILPQRKTSKSAGYDLRSLTDVTILPDDSAVLETGVKVCMEQDEVVLLYIRSSLAFKKGLMLSTGVSVIDADYYNNSDNDGHILLSIRNVSNEPQHIEKGERVAQAVFVNYMTVLHDMVSKKRVGGIGSTDV